MAWDELVYEEVAHRRCLPAEPTSLVMVPLGRSVRWRTLTLTKAASMRRPRSGLRPAPSSTTRSVTSRLRSVATGVPCGTTYEMSGALAACLAELLGDKHSNLRLATLSCRDATTSDDSEGGPRTRCASLALRLARREGHMIQVLDKKQCERSNWFGYRKPRTAHEHRGC